MKKIFKFLFKTFLILIVSLIAFGCVVFSLPGFGDSPDGESYPHLKESAHYDSTKSQFVNIVPTNSSWDASQYWDGTKKFFFSNDSGTVPTYDLPMDTLAWEQNDSTLWFSWLGHSTVYMNIEGKKVWIDPVFSDKCSPVQWAGSSRFHPFPHDTAEIKNVDFVVISHDHYDHLDYLSIKYLKDYTDKFLVPLGVGAHLYEWGVDTNKIIEFDWWQNITSDSLTITCTPARHFSGRSLSDQNATLWSSWCFNGKKNSVFYSGDTGYMKNFKEIGEKLGPFDLSFIQSGAYDSLWADIHMFPTEAIQTHKDVKANYMVPVHWSTWKLALHPWDEPGRKLLHNRDTLNILFPRLNQQVFVSDSLTIEETPWFLN